MKALILVLGLFRRLALALLLIVWVQVLYESIRRGPNHLIRWFYKNTLYMPPKLEWKTFWIVISFYLAVTASSMGLGVAITEEFA